LDVVAYMADRVGVMYGGKIMEEAPARALVDRPLHPYTKLLFDSAPGAGRKVPEVASVGPTPTRPLEGCPFQSRCPLAFDRCRTEVPVLRKVDKAGTRRAACHRVEPERV